VYLANESFDRFKLMSMERLLLRVIDFDLGAPISYRFLRRYSRVNRTDLPTLTLARFILETSLMFLDFCRLSESLIAVACLVLAVRMKKMGDWNPTLEKNCGYSFEEVEPLVISLNHMMIIKHRSNFPATVYNKYSHVIFYEVAAIPNLPDQLPTAYPIVPVSHPIVPPSVVAS